MVTMQQLTFVRPGLVEWRERPKPEIEEGRDAIVRPIASTTCDLDQAIIRGGTPFKGPFAIGHECVAEVIDVGDRCRSVRPGDVVIVPWHIACGECAHCRAGLQASCTSVRDHAMFGHPVGGDYGGLFDDYVRVPWADNMLVHVPAGVDPYHLASFSDNVSIAWEVLRRHLQAKPGAEVLVAGGSASICLFVADVANALGARVTYIDHSERRCEIARSYGVQVIRGTPGPEHGQFDFIIDASVNPKVLQQLFRMMKPEGFLESVGIYFDDVEIPIYDMYMRGVTFRIGRGNARRQLPHVLDLKARGCIHPEHAHTATHSFEQIPDMIVASAKPLFVRERIALT